MSSESASGFLREAAQRVCRAGRAGVAQIIAPRAVGEQARGEERLVAQGFAGGQPDADAIGAVRRDGERDQPDQETKPPHDRPPLDPEDEEHDAADRDQHDCQQDVRRVDREREDEQRGEAPALGAADAVGVDQQQRGGDRADRGEDVGHGEAGEEGQRAQQRDDRHRRDRAPSSAAGQRDAPQRRDDPRDGKRLHRRHQPTSSRPPRRRTGTRRTPPTATPSGYGPCARRASPARCRRRQFGRRDDAGIDREFVAERIIIVGVGEHRRMAEGGDHRDDQRRAGEHDQPWLPPLRGH